MSRQFNTCLDRLATFVNWTDEIFGLSPSQLANLGYILIWEYRIAKIICSACNFQIEDLKAELDIISAQHNRFSSGCKFNKVETSKCLHANGSVPTELGLAKITDKAIFERSLKFLKSHGCEDQGTKGDTSRKEMDKINWRRNASNKMKTLIQNILNREENGFRISSKILDKKKSNSENSNDETNGGQAAITPVEIQQQAAHPGLITREERRRTFRNQEQKYSHFMHQNIIDRLVEAGLYYIGPTDNVRCFFCNGGLKKFSSDDDPIREHRKWFPKCKYICYLEQRDIKIRCQIVARDSPRETVDIEGCISSRDKGRETEATQQNCNVSDDFSPPRKVLESREVKARLELPIYAILQEMGYQKDHIRQAIEFRFATLGDDYGSMRELVLDILNVHGSCALPRLPKVDQELARPIAKFEQYSHIRTCQVCLVNEITTVFLPCGHYVCCNTCTTRLTHCCICRALIRGTVKALTAREKS